MHWFWIWLALFLVVTYGFMESYRNYAPAVVQPLSYVEPKVPAGLQVLEKKQTAEVPVVSWARVVKDQPEDHQDESKSVKNLKRVRPLGVLRIEDAAESASLIELPSKSLEDYTPVVVDVFEGYERPHKKTRKIWGSSEDAEDESRRKILDVSASAQTSMLVKHFGDNVLRVRENPVTTRLRETMDDIEDLAARQGLSVDEFLSIRNQAKNPSRYDEDLKARKTALFRDETNVSYDLSQQRPLTNNLAEVAGLVRDCLQHIPTNNEELAVVVLRDILRARLEARELNVKVPQCASDQIDTLRFYQRSNDSVLSNLASQILSRL